MRWFTLAVATTLAFSVLPVDSVSGSENHDHHWNGYVLEREKSLTTY